MLDGLYESFVKMPMTSPRYALYFTPVSSSPWREFGAAWLGRCVLDGGLRDQPSIDGLDAAGFSQLTLAPRRYGFHATLKAPFRLASNQTVAALRSALDLFCAQRESFALAPPEAMRLKHFLALAWPAPDLRVNALAAASVMAFDHFRAVPDAFDLARRRAAGLSAREEELLLQWGYPHVLDQFRFHFSLTGPIGDTPAGTVESVLDAARASLAKLRDTALLFDAISLFEQPSPGAPFRVLQRSPLRAQRGRLIYLTGPSGAGKDTLIDYVRRHLPSGARVRFAQRVITRPADGRGEVHLPMATGAFADSEASGRFAMVWRANGHAYGIGREILEWLAAGETVVVNGSRAYAAQAAEEFPSLEQVVIRAGRDTLRRRLLMRGRESEAAVEARLARFDNDSVDAAATPAGALSEIRNDGEINVAGEQLLALVLSRMPMAAY